VTYYSRSLLPAGGQGTYSVPFPYLDKAHIVVLDANALYSGVVTWTTPSTISLSPDISGGHAVEIRRVTPRGAPLATYTPGAVQSDDLNKNTLQNLYIAQETLDLIGAPALDPPGTSAIDTEINSHLQAGANVSLTQAGGKLVVAASTDTAAVDTEINSHLQAGSGVTLTPSGGHLIVASTGSSTAAIDAEIDTHLLAGTGISLTPSGGKLIVGRTDTPLTIANVDNEIDTHLLAGTGVTLTPSGGRLIVGASGSGAPVTSVNSRVGAVSLSSLDITGVASLKDYGAACNGTTDDSAAWNSAITAINAGAISALIIPGLSTYNGAMPTITKDVSIIGVGSRVSGIIQLASTDITTMSIVIDVTTAYHRVTLRDFTFWNRGGQNLAQALLVSFPTTAWWLNLENVDVLPSDPISAGHTGWNRGIELINVKSSSIINCNYVGYIDQGLPNPAKFMVSAWHFYLHSINGLYCTDIKFTNCGTNWCDTAYKLRGHQEGISWEGCAPGFLGVAWDIQLDSNYPYFGWSNCQCEYTRYGLYMQHAAFINVSNCQFYSAGTGVNMDRCAIYILDAVHVDLNHNFMMGNGASGAGAGTDSGIYLGGTTDGVTVAKLTGNTVQAPSLYGIRYDGKSAQCMSYNDMIYYPMAGCIAYKNSATLGNANGGTILDNSRRGMRIWGGSQAIGQSSAAVQNTTSTTVSPTQTVQASIGWHFQPGDRLKVKIACLVHDASGSTQAQAIVREKNHAAGTGSPFTILQVARSTQKNWTRTDFLNSGSGAFGAYFEDTIEFDVVAEAADGLLVLETLVGSGTATQDYAHLAVDLA
jgi:hypothetical protein